MKKSAIALFLMAAMFGTTATVQAQRNDSTRRHGRHNMERGQHHAQGIPDLSQEQQKKIAALRTTFTKETLPLTNVLAEKRAHLHTLQSADKADLNAINSTIDEMTQLQSQLMKKRASNHEAIRKLLTDDQRVAFDSHAQRRGGFHHKQGKRN